MIDVLSLFENDAVETFRELGIEPMDAVFVKSGFFGKIMPLSVFQKKYPNKEPPKLFVCELAFTDGLYSFALPALPKKPPRALKKLHAALSRRVLAVNNAVIRKIMAEAKKNAEFVERFNSELFFKHVYYNDLRLTRDELFKFYETEPYYKKINISANRDKIPFIAGFAMAYYGCTLDDIFTIGGIFSMQPDRHSDNAKKQAGKAVFNLIFRDDKREINEVLEKIGAAIIGVEPPKVELKRAELMAKNYTVYFALSEIGRVFSEIFFYNGNRNLDGALKAANELKKYAYAYALCEKMAILGSGEDYRETDEYKKCAEFF